MTSPARIWYPNTSYHITARGNRRSDIFKDDEDFQVYLELLMRPWNIILMIMK
jgi:REP element-mobilizing transposase RayT